MGQGHCCLGLNPVHLCSVITVGWQAKYRTVYNDIAPSLLPNFNAQWGWFLNSARGLASGDEWNRYETKNTASPQKAM